MEILGYIALGVLGLLLLAAVLLAAVRRAGEKVLRRMTADAAGRGERILLGDGFASFRGRVSDGYPLRGNTALLLTDRALRVEVFWPRPARRIEIPHARMRRIEVTHAFMGMFDPAGFVVLHFAVETGEDAIGFTVRRFSNWVGAIVKTARPHLQAIQGRKPDEAAPPAAAAGAPQPEHGATGAGPDAHPATPASSPLEGAAP